MTVTVVAKGYVNNLYSCLWAAAFQSTCSLSPIAACSPRRLLCLPSPWSALLAAALQLVVWTQAFHTDGEVGLRAERVQEESSESVYLNHQSVVRVIVA